MRELPPELAVIYRISPELLRGHGPHGWANPSWCNAKFLGGFKKWVCTRPLHKDPIHISMDNLYNINHIWVIHGKAERS